MSENRLQGYWMYAVEWDDISTDGLKIEEKYVLNKLTYNMTKFVFTLSK